MTDWFEVTDDNVMVKVAEVAPAATVTVGGTEAKLEFDESAISAPPAGAGCESVTVPVMVPPPDTELEDSVTLRTCGCAGAAPFWTAIYKL